MCTRHVAYDRYNIVNESDLQAAAQSLNAYFASARGTLAGTLAELLSEPPEENDTESVDETEEFLEPASGIEPPTCGLRIRPGQFLKRSVYQVVSPF